MNLLDDERICPACGRSFATRKSCNMHMSRAQSCAWYRRGKLADLGPLDLEGEGGDIEALEDVQTPGEPSSDEEDLDDIFDEGRDREPFHFIPIENLPPPHEYGIGEAGPGPSTVAHNHQVQHRALDDDDDTRVEDEDGSVGKVIRMNDNLHRRWHKLFGAGDGDAMDVDEDIEEPSFFHPFASELDWRIANWMVKDNPGHNAFNRLLSIPGVSETYSI